MTNNNLIIGVQRETVSRASPTYSYTFSLGFLYRFQGLRGEKGKKLGYPLRGCAGTGGSAISSCITLNYSKLLIYIEFYKGIVRGKHTGMVRAILPVQIIWSILCKTS